MQFCVVEEFIWDLIRSLKQNFNIIGIEMWAEVAQNGENFEFLAKKLSLKDESLERFFTKLGVGGESQVRVPSR